MDHIILVSHNEEYVSFGSTYGCHDFAHSWQANRDYKDNTFLWMSIVLALHYMIEYVLDFKKTELKVQKRMKSKYK